MTVNEKEIELFSDTRKGTTQGTVRKISHGRSGSGDITGRRSDGTAYWKRSSYRTEQERSLIMELVSKGELSPVFFGSALTNFGVETFLAAFPAHDYITASEKI